jgi:hypothetical protein
MKLAGRCSARKPARQWLPTGTTFANRNKTQLPANGTRENLINSAARQRDLRKLPSTLPARWHILRENASAPATRKHSMEESRHTLQPIGAASRKRLVNQGGPRKQADAEDPARSPRGSFAAKQQRQGGSRADGRSEAPEQPANAPAAAQATWPGKAAGMQLRQSGPAGRAERERET